uniref:Cytochrome c oxidase assembly protein COX11, mitochondrial n=1 Tax=Schistocephalus solidus TaxID=70667 RepID=A0A0X3PTR4_SCHSO
MIIRSLFTCCRSSGLLRVSKLIDNALDLQLRSFYSGGRGRDNLKRLSAIYYCAALSVFMLGFSYAGVPLYRIYCAKTGGGTNSEGARAKSDRVEKMKPVRDRKITVEFSADTYSRMAWNFKPAQKSVTIVPGETALAFYTAKNPTDRPITGIATYTVVPLDAAKYFNKIQCFCFEEQRLNPQEEVDLPVFFFLDPEFDDDPRLMRVTNIILHYTFFEAKKEKLMIPGISTPVLEEPSVT